MLAKFNSATKITQRTHRIEAVQVVLTVFELPVDVVLGKHKPVSGHFSGFLKTPANFSVSNLETSKLQTCWGV